ncbi:hypothetical protein LCGC14_0303080 [marine sediment metagenome]|uniref:Uncharacterized protein n=1 Tax=marine sediment metagenome TaxID=412755 RepID=A0A0F9U6T9_9ZZZZ
MQKEIKDGGTHPFVYTIPDPTRISAIQSPRNFNLDDKTQVMRILATAHKLGIVGLTPQEITDIGKLEPKDYTYRRRCSDLKNDRQLYVVGWRYDGKRLNEVLALGTAIPKEYFSNTIIDSHVSHHTNHGFTRCGSCGSLNLGGKGTARILKLVKKLRHNKVDNDIIELLNLLFPERHLPQNGVSGANK